MKYIYMFIAILGLVIFCAKNVLADNAVSTASVTNVVPISSGVTLAPSLGTITLTENTTTNVTVTASVTDDNGCEDISSVSVKLFRTDLSSACSNDNNNCYTQAATIDPTSCTPGGSDLTSLWTATIPVAHYADPTDAGSANASTTWSAHVIPSDSSGVGTAGADDSKEMSTLTALNVTSPLAYGAMALGADTGTSDQTSTVTNTGNAAIGTQVDGYGSVSGDGKSLICTIGSMPTESERYSLTPATSYASKTWLTGTPTTIPTFSIAKATSGTPSTNSIYWGFGMPAGGVSGSCTGMVVFTAV